MAAAEELGVDVETYRMLKQLEQRDICPEDYDLLGRLDESVKAATLSPEELEQFPIQVYPVRRAFSCSMVSDSDTSSTADSGYDTSGREGDSYRESSGSDSDSDGDEDAAREKTMKTLCITHEQEDAHRKNQDLKVLKEEKE